MGPSGQRLKATDVGVTATEIHLGFLLLDLGAAGNLGVSFAVNDQESTWEGFVNEINTSGGILGRKVVPHYRKYDPLSLDDMRAACIYLTENIGVLAVFDLFSYSRDPQLCVAEQHDTPFVWAGEGLYETFAARAPNRFVSIPMTRERLLRNLVTELHADGALRGHTIGILDAAFTGDIEAVNNAFVPTLERYGYSVAYRATLPDDLAEGAAQIPIEVQRMRAAGVDLVFLLVNALQNSQFVGEADRQRFHPTYYTSDFGSGVFEGFDYPDSFEGAWGLTQKRIGEWRTGGHEPAADINCMEQFKRLTSERPEWGSNTHTAVGYSCNAVRAFAAAARAAGPNLTRDRLVKSFGSIGRIPLAGFGGGSFAPGKNDAADLVRWVRFKADCDCWEPARPFKRVSV